MSDHCKSPDTCPINKERERDMETIKQDYSETKEALKKTDEKLNSVVTVSAVTNEKLDGLIGEIRRDRIDNQRAHEIHLSEFKAIHKRVTDAKIETTQAIGDAKLASAQADGKLEIKQATTKGLLKGKFDLAEMGKLVFLISAVLGIFKYLMPGT